MSASLSTIATSTSSYTGTPLNLSVTASPSDLLGIGQVSGFHGPGAWTAWFLTIATSWIRILRRLEHKIDLNAWLFLLGMNWAAIDIFRTSLQQAHGSVWSGLHCRLWGTGHALFQNPDHGRFLQQPRLQIAARFHTSSDRRYQSPHSQHLRHCLRIT